MEPKTSKERLRQKAEHVRKERDRIMVQCADLTDGVTKEMNERSAVDRLVEQCLAAAEDAAAQGHTQERFRVTEQPCYGDYLRLKIGQAERAVERLRHPVHSLNAMVSTVPMRSYVAEDDTPPSHIVITICF